MSHIFHLPVLKLVFYFKSKDNLKIIEELGEESGKIFGSFIK